MSTAEDTEGAIRLIRRLSVPWLKKLVADLRQLKPGTVLTRFVVDKVVLGQGFYRVLRFSLLIFTPSLLSISVYDVGDENRPVVGRR
jgi:hypothetical protein